MDDRIRIHYPHGYMELVISLFFPCVIRESRILFPLIKTYAEESEINKLRQYLKTYVREKELELKEMEADRRRGGKRSGCNYKHTETLYKRALRNLTVLS